MYKYRGKFSHLLVQVKEEKFLFTSTTCMSKGGTFPLCLYKFYACKLLTSVGLKIKTLGGLNQETNIKSHTPSP